MVKTHDDLTTPSPHRRRWAMPVVVAAIAVVGVGVGIAVANRDTTPAAQPPNGQLADISQACATWMNGDAHWGSESTIWCQDMTNWMRQEIASGSMMGSMMWGDPERMLSTCRAWMDTNPSTQRPTDWCDNMLRGMWPHMSGDWEQWDDQMNGGMMGG